MKLKLLFFAFSLGFASLVSAQCKPDTVMYAKFKDSLLLKSKAINHFGGNKLRPSLKDSACVAQVFLNNDSIQVLGAKIMMGAYKFSNPSTIPAATKVSPVLVSLYEVDENYFPVKKIDSVVVDVKESKYYTVTFKAPVVVKSNFAIGARNIDVADKTSRLRVYANNAFNDSISNNVTYKGYGEGLGFVRDAISNQWLVNSIYFDGQLPTPNTAVGYSAGSETDSTINWDWYINPIISYQVSADFNTTDAKPGNLVNVELSRLSKLTIGANPILSLGGFKNKWLAGDFKNYAWQVGNNYYADSVYKFTMSNNFKGVTSIARVEGYTRACEDIKGFLLAIDDKNTISNLSIYPNPTSSKFNVAFSTENASNVSLRVVDFAGKLVYSNDFVGNSNSINEHVIDLTNQAEGLYILQIATDKNTISRKIVRN
jgi:hypothetical protein